MMFFDVDPRCRTLPRSSQLHNTMLRRTRTLLLAVITAIILLILYFHSTNPPQHFHLTPTNATLEFGTILAVSRANSPRQPSLLWAANLTGLEVVLPAQPAWTDTDVRTFRADKGSTISNGSARAWMGHLNALHWFLGTDKEAALIIEDDVDWDISLRHTQRP